MLVLTELTVKEIRSGTGTPAVPMLTGTSLVSKSGFDTTSR